VCAAAARGSPRSAGTSAARGQERRAGPRRDRRGGPGPARRRETPPAPGPCAPSPDRALAPAVGDDQLVHGEVLGQRDLDDDDDDDDARPVKRHRLHRVSEDSRRSCATRYPVPVLNRGQHRNDTSALSSVRPFAAPAPTVSFVRMPARASRRRQDLRYGAPCPSTDRCCVEDGHTCEWPPTGLSFRPRDRPERGRKDDIANGPTEPIKIAVAGRLRAHPADQSADRTACAGLWRKRRTPVVSRCRTPRGLARGRRVPTSDIRRTGMPLSGGPVSVLVHDGSWRYGRGGRL